MEDYQFRGGDIEQWNVLNVIARHFSAVIWHRVAA